MALKITVSEVADLTTEPSIPSAWTIAASATVALRVETLMAARDPIRPMNPIEFRDACREMQTEATGRSEAGFAEGFFARRYADADAQGWKAGAAAARWRALAGLLRPGEAGETTLLEAAAVCPLDGAGGFDPVRLREETERRRAERDAVADAVREERVARRRTGRT